MDKAEVADLHYIDRGDFLARRKAIYEEKYPETKQHVIAGKTRGRGHSKEETATALSAVAEPIHKSFVEDTSNKIGISERTLMEDIQISESLSEEVKEFVKEKDLPKILQSNALSWILVLDKCNLKKFFCCSNNQTKLQY